MNVPSKNLLHPARQKFKLFKPFNWKLFDSHRLWKRRATFVPPLLSPTGRVPAKWVAGWG